VCQAAAAPASASLAFTADSHARVDLVGENKEEKEGKKTLGTLSRRGKNRNQPRRLQPKLRLD